MNTSHSVPREMSSVNEMRTIDNLMLFRGLPRNYLVLLGSPGCGLVFRTEPVRRQIAKRQPGSLGLALFGEGRPTVHAPTSRRCLPREANRVAGLLPRSAALAWVRCSYSDQSAPACARCAQLAFVRCAMGPPFPLESGAAPLCVPLLQTSRVCSKSGGASKRRQIPRDIDCLRLFSESILTGRGAGPMFSLSAGNAGSNQGDMDMARKAGSTKTVTESMFFANENAWGKVRITLTWDVVGGCGCWVKTGHERIA